MQPSRRDVATSASAGAVPANARGSAVAPGARTTARTETGSKPGPRVHVGSVSQPGTPDQPAKLEAPVGCATSVTGSAITTVHDVSQPNSGLDTVPGPVPLAV